MFYRVIYGEKYFAWAFYVCCNPQTDRFPIPNKWQKKIKSNKIDTMDENCSKMYSVHILPVAKLLSTTF